MIAFKNIPLNLLTPGVYAEIDSSRALSGVQLSPHYVMIVGQYVSGSATANTPYRPDSVSACTTLFAATSQLSQMFAAYRAHDTLTPVYVIGIANPTGTNATGSIVVSGTATEAGESAMYIGGRRIPVAVTNGMTAAQWETAALAAFAVYNVDLPVTAAANAGTGIDFTALPDGTIGNQIMLGLALKPGERTPAGFTFTITAMNGGATDPSYSSAISALGEDPYATMALGAIDTTALGLVVTELESRFGPMRMIDGHGFACKYDSVANLVTYGANFNSANLTVLGAEASALLPLPWEVAAQTAAISALQAQTDPAVAMVGRVYSNMLGAHRGSRFSRANRQSLLEAGIATVRCAVDGRLQTDFLITTYKTNSVGAADPSLRPLYRVRTLSAYRYSLCNRIAGKFADFKMAGVGGEVSGQKILTSTIARSEVLSHFLDCGDLGWVDISTFDQFKAELLIQPNTTNTDRMDFLVPPNFINAFLVGAINVQFLQ